MVAIFIQSTVASNSTIESVISIKLPNSHGDFRSDERKRVSGIAGIPDDPLKLDLA